MAAVSTRSLASVWAGHASDAAHLVVLALLVPVVILAIGTPLALAVRLLLEIARKLFGR
jgi:hypothetical protein